MPIRTAARSRAGSEDDSIRGGPILQAGHSEPHQRPQETANSLRVNHLAHFNCPTDGSTNSAVNPVRCGRSLRSWSTPVRKKVDDRLDPSRELRRPATRARQTNSAQARLPAGQAGEVNTNGSRAGRAPSQAIGPRRDNGHQRVLATPIAEVAANATGILTAPGQLAGSQVDRA